MTTRAELMLDIVRSARIIAVDCETTGLDAFEDHLIGVVVAGAGHSIYVPTEHSGGGNAFDDPRLFYKELARSFALRSRLGLLSVGHNLAYDLWMLGKAGIVLDAPLEDTMINAVLIDDNEFKYGLAECATRFGAPAKFGSELEEVLKTFGRKTEKDVMKHFHRLPGDHHLVTEYAEGDGVTTLALHAIQQRYLDERDLRRVHRLECDLIPHLYRMRARGIRIDNAYGPTALRHIREEAARVRMHFPDGFNPSKPPEVIQWLKDQGVPHDAFPLTPGGKPSTAKEFLATLPQGEKVLELRRIEKAEGTFVRPLLGEKQRGGRIFPELVQAKNDRGNGTHTGRFACRDPNMQQVPKRRETIGKLIRPLIIPDAGFELAESDVSQQEVRLYAHYANEKALLDAYNSPVKVDVHELTRKLLGLPEDTEPHQPNRWLAKTLGLSIFNGMQAPSVANALNISESKAAEYISRFLDGYPAIHQFMSEAPKVAFRTGYVRTTLGRICHLRWDERKNAVSRVIQGSGADQMKLMLLRACRYADANPRIQILMPIHDSLLWQRARGTDTSEFQRVLDDNSDLYQIVNGEKVPMRLGFPMSTAFGRNWSEASYGK
jgi:DNA polymerase I